MKPLSNLASTSQQRFRAKPEARYLRDNKAGTMANRRVVLRTSAEDIRQSWLKAAAFATDMIQNSGQLSGAATQVVSDTVGNGLVVQPAPDVAALGYDEKERRQLIAEMRNVFEQWAKSKRECDFRGKLNLKKMQAVSLRWDMAFGESIVTSHYFDESDRAKYGLKFGTKLMMVPPTQLVQDTDPSIGLFQGVFSDQYDRPTHYRFRRSKNGQIEKYDWPVMDQFGRPLIEHLYDPNDATDYRGISKLTPAIRKYIASEDLDEATLQTAILQTLFVASITSEMPTEQAFDILEQIKNQGGDEGRQVFDAFMNNLSDKIEGGDELYLGPTPQFNALRLGEKLEIDGAKTPGGDYLPFKQSLSRETARAIGITYSSYSLDNTGATYASINMDNATIWPVVENRRAYNSEPLATLGYDSLMDEAFGRGMIQLKGGYQAFVANREKLLKKTWQGPSRPVGDDSKAAKSARERIEARISTIGVEARKLGLQREDLLDEILDDHQFFEGHGMKSPYGKDNMPMGQAPNDEVEDDDDQQ